MGLQNCLALQFVIKMVAVFTQSTVNPMPFYCRANSNLAFSLFCVDRSRNGSLTETSCMLAGPGYARNVKARGELSSS